MRVASAEVSQLFGDRLTWQEALRGGPPWLCSELVATELGRGRLVDWLEAGSPVADPEDVVFNGDQEVGELVVETLKKIPAPPVVHWVVTGTLILGTGRSSLAWADSPPALDKPRALIVIAGTGDDDEDAGIIAHEISHSVLHNADEPKPLVRVRQRKAFDQAFDMLANAGAEAQVNKHRRSAQRAKHLRERQACALACALGFTGRAANPERWRRR